MNANLDFLAARYGHRIVTERADVAASDLENAVTASLDILAQQGVFALFLWLWANGDPHLKPEREAILSHLGQLFHDSESPIRIASGGSVAPPQVNVAAALETVNQELADNLPKLFLARSLIEQVLIYARHRCKTE